LSGVAKDYVTFNLKRTQPGLKFPAFWAQSNDYAPDEDNGGNGENGLQQMILQANGKKIFLLPAWPREWNVSFKLHVPFQIRFEALSKTVN
jgi:alpha-L-fucosidase 2